MKTESIMKEYINIVLMKNAIIAEKNLKNQICLTNIPAKNIKKCHKNNPVSNRLFSHISKLQILKTQ